MKPEASSLAIVADSAEWLLHGSCVYSDMKRVLSQLPWYTRQVLIQPCKDVPILTEEADELAFLFLLQPAPMMTVCSGWTRRT